MCRLYFICFIVRRKLWLASINAFSYDRNGKQQLLSAHIEKPSILRMCATTAYRALARFTRDTINQMCGIFVRTYFGFQSVWQVHSIRFDCFVFSLAQFQWLFIGNICYIHKGMEKHLCKTCWYCYSCYRNSLIFTLRSRSSTSMIEVIVRQKCTQSSNIERQR